MLIAFVEAQDQFDNVIDISLINEDEESIKAYKNANPSSYSSTNTFKFYKVENFNDEFEFLKTMFENYLYSSNTIYEWMDENESNLIA